MLYVYIGCLVFGALYSVASMILGGHDFSHGGLDHAGVDGSGDHAAVPSPFNPLVIASAITAFGAAGLVTKMGLGLDGFLSFIVSVVSALTVGSVMFFGIVKLMYNSQSNSIYSINDMLGIEAEVITPIPQNGMGEIAYVLNGVRCTLSAKSAHNDEIPRGDKVIVKEVFGNYAVVLHKVTLEEFEAMEFEKDKESNKEI